MTKIAEYEGRMDYLNGRIRDAFAQAGPENDWSKVTCLDANDTEGKVAEIRALNDEATDLGVKLDAERMSDASLAEIKDALDQRAKVDTSGRALAALAGADPGRKIVEDVTQRQSIGQMFVDSDAYKGRPRPGSMGHGPSAALDVGLGEIKATLFQRSTGWSPAEVQTGLVQPFPDRPVMVADLFPAGSTTASAIVYMEETTATNNAAERAEGAAYAESAIALVKRTAPVETVGTSLPVTDEQLADVAQARSYIDGRLGYFVMARLDSQLINGSGTTPAIRGILNAANLQTQAKGALPGPDAFFLAGQKIRGTGAFGVPNAAVLNPTDWSNIRLLRTDDGVYVWGNPSEAGPERIFGWRIVQTPSIAAGTAIVGDFSPLSCQLYVRQGLDVQVGYVNDDFKLGQQTVRAGIRVAAVYYRGACFCTVTGL